MKLSKYYRCVYITKDQSGGFALYMLCSHFPQFVSSSSHTKRFTFRLRRKLAIRESEMIKWTWKNVDAEEINFGPYTDESNEGATIEEEATTEEEANNRKAMGKPQWKWKCRTPWSMKREASDPLGLLDLELTSKRPQTRDTSKEEDGYEGDEGSDYILVSTRPVWCSSRIFVSTRPVWCRIIILQG